MKPSQLFEWGIDFSGLFVGIAIGIWASLAFYPEHGRLLQRVASIFVLAGIILQAVVKYKCDQSKKSNKTDEKPDA
jgi:gas vesicle protein